VQLDSPLVWNGEQLKTTGSFTYTLNEAEREEINSALEFFLSTWKHSPSNFLSHYKSHTVTVLLFCLRHFETKGC
jgi:hypothetical protein